MVNSNQDSLRAQIIDSMLSKSEWSPGLAEKIFDEAIMPVLDAAMKAGELLLHRATKPQLPVSDSILVWLEGTCASLEQVEAEAATVSKRDLLNIMSHITAQARAALDDARNLQRGAGNPLTGITLPKKG